jgi:DNA mismatch repair protein MutL
VEFTPADADFLQQNLQTFIDLGFGIEGFGGNSFLVTGIPAHFPQENVEGMLRDVLDDLRDAPGMSRRPDEVRIAQAACKHAVRAEDPLTREEIETLLTALAETEMPYTCPHGRPVMINLPEIELQKRFGRRV